MTFADKFKALFGKTIDEAMKEETKTDEKKESKDESAPSAIDKILETLKALTSEVEAMKGEKKDDTAPPAAMDEKKEEPKAEEKKEESKDDSEAPAEEKTEPSDAERLKALETAVSQILEKLNGDEDDSEESEESEDEASSESKDEETKKGMTGDTLARAEILSPGIAATKDIKVVALKNAYATKEGKAVIDAFTGGKAPAFDSAEKVESIFIGASEVLKVQRTGKFAGSKNTKTFANDSHEGVEMTPAKINEMNRTRYGQK